MNRPDNIEQMIQEIASLARSTQLDSLVKALRRTDIPASEAIRNVDLALRTFRRIGLASADDARNLLVLPALAESYEQLGGLAQAYDVYSESLDAARRLTNAPDEADLLWKMGRVQRKRNRWDESLAHLRESRQIHEGQENPVGVARCRIAEGNVAWQRGDLDSAAEGFRQALETGQQADDHHIAADATNNLGILATIQGQFDEAEIHYQNARALYEQLGNQDAVARVHHNLGMCHTGRRNWTEALDAFEQSLKISLELGNMRLSGSSYVQKATVFVELKDTEVAAIYCTRALDIFNEVDFPLGRAEAYKVLGRIFTMNDSLTTAEGLLTESVGICEAYENPLGASEARRELGLLQRARHREDSADRLLKEALEGFESIGAQRDAERTRELLAA